MLNARAISMQGLGRSSRLVAMQGLWPVGGGNENVGVSRSSMAARVREQYELLDEVRRKSDAVKRAFALAKKAAEEESARKAISDVYEASMAAMRRVMGTIALADVAVTQGVNLRAIADQVTAQIAAAKAEFVALLGDLAPSKADIQRNSNRRRAIILIILLLSL